jgi:hypothetical protein
VTPAYEKLQRAEEEFLRACGWTKMGEDAWAEPELAWTEEEVESLRLPRVLPFGHALNSELAHGRERGTHTSKDRTPLYAAWETYLEESGWTASANESGAILWTAPKDGRRRSQANFTKAVNSQKAHDRSPGGRWASG